MGFWRQKSQETLGYQIIILTTFDDDEFIYSALRSKWCFRLAEASTEELYEAIKVVYQGGAMINPVSLVKCSNFLKWPKPISLLL